MNSYYYNLNQFFLDVSAHNSQKTALRYSDRTVSYAELTRLSECLTKKLIDLGCRRGDVIAIGHNKNVLSYALMLASLRLGVAYVNIDVASPTARLLNILKTSCVSFLFYDDMEYDKSMETLAREHNCTLHFLSESKLPEITEADLELHDRLSCIVDGATIAYVMFTSGSTGNPKGVAVTHQNLLHFIAWGTTRFNVTTKDNFANLSPMYFDNSVFDFYVGLFSGASLSPIPRYLLTKPYELTAYVGKMVCTIWFSVPSLLIYLVTMKAISSEVLFSLRCIIFGGEGYAKVELLKLYKIFVDQACLVNVYGPTECTCICSAHTLSDADFKDLEGLPTLGQLNPNFDYRILDEKEQDSSLGELCLIGPNVASGYFNEPKRTNVSFFTITDPSRYMKRMYRTGDIVREEAGNLNFVGRKDNQIKHMGYRIELEEIELALMKLSYVNQAAVVYVRNNSAYGKIIAYISSKEKIEENVILFELSEYLPSYMLPNNINVLTELPKNSNGKIDRRLLLSRQINIE